MTSGDGAAAPAAHRHDIDGLRALAVVPVVLYHAFHDWTPGGFVGVDVFFVISGYLITRLIARDQQQQRFSLVHFYERRVRRILPALFAMLAAVSAAAGILYMPEDLATYGRSLLATALFGSNLFFWTQTGYFDAPAASQALLHTWSLAIEEQFYLLFPVVLIALRRYAARAWKAIIVGLGVISFLWALVLARTDPTSAFFLLPARAWELLLGAALAIGIVPALRTSRSREGCAGGGLVLIAAAVLVLTEATPFVGAAAIIACLGAAMLIHAGASGTSRAGQWLSARPVVFVGLISYSLYLWHWPLLALVRYHQGGALETGQAALCVLLAFGLAVLSWAYVETPFRRKGGVLGRPRLFALAGLSSVTAVILAVLAVQSGGFPGRFPGGVARLAAAASAHDPRQAECMGGVGRWIAPSEACDYGADVPPTWAVWGDSHAATLIYPLGHLAARHGRSVRLYSYGGCPPVLGVKNKTRAPGYDCPGYNRAVLDALIRLESIRTVVVVARHTLYIYGHARGLGPAEDAVGDHTITDLTGAEIDESSRGELYARELQRTLGLLAKAGKRIVLLYPIPEVGRNVPLWLARLMQDGRSEAELEPTLAFFRERHAFVMDVLDRLTPADAYVRLYPHERLCDDQRCRVSVDGVPLYFDDDHLSLAGGAQLIPLFEPLFRHADKHAGL